MKNKKEKIRGGGQSTESKPDDKAGGDTDDGKSDEEKVDVSNIKTKKVDGVPRVPEIPDGSLGKMDTNDVRKLAKYYEDMLIYLDKKRVAEKDGKKAFNIASRMKAMKDEIRDLQGELIKRGQ